jgi:hypothetical protein
MVRSRRASSPAGTKVWIGINAISKPTLRKNFNDSRSILVISSSIALAPRRYLRLILGRPRIVVDHAPTRPGATPALSRQGLGLEKDHETDFH